MARTATDPLPLPRQPLPPSGLRRGDGGAWRRRRGRGRGRASAAKPRVVQGVVASRERWRGTYGSPSLVHSDATCCRPSRRVRGGRDQRGARDARRGVPLGAPPPPPPKCAMEWNEMEWNGICNVSRSVRSCRRAAVPSLWLREAILFDLIEGGSSHLSISRCSTSIRTPRSSPRTARSRASRRGVVQQMAWCAEGLPPSTTKMYPPPAEVGSGEAWSRLGSAWAWSVRLVGV